MPISQDRSILFVHIPKTAGKSIGQAFGVYAEERIRGRSLLNRAAVLLLRLTGDKSAYRDLTGMIDASFFSAHMTLREIMVLELMKANELAHMTKISVCRNPYDRAVSIFNHMNVIERKYDNTPTGFRTFWKEWSNRTPNHLRSSHHLRSIARPQWEFCVDLEGRMAMDHILRFETLRADVLALANTLSLGNVDLPWLGNNRDTRQYAHYYDTPTTDLIEALYGKDFDLFGYDRSFEPTGM